MITKRKINLTIFSATALLLVFGLYYIYSLIKIDEELNMRVEEHAHHVGRYGDEKIEIDHFLMKAMTEEDTGAKLILQHESHQHEHEHEHENLSKDYAHMEWVNKPYLNPIYRTNLLLKSLVLCILVTVFFIYSYVIDKSQEFKELNEDSQE